MKKIVIIGGVAGGASAAARIRRLDEQAQIIMLERSGYVSYANCGLPYYIGGEIEDKSKLTLQTPQSFKNRFGIDVRVRHEAQEIDVQRKLVRVKNLETGEGEELPYDKLVLSPGARPSRPNLPGVEDEAEARRVQRAISSFLWQQREDKRVIFIRRYWYFDSIASLSDRTGYSQSKIKNILYHMRLKLRAQLESEGIEL